MQADLNFLLSIAIIAEQIWVSKEELWNEVCVVCLCGVVWFFLQISEALEVFLVSMQYVASP